MQAGLRRIADRARELLGRSDTANILWRKILARVFHALPEGRPPKQWTIAPAAVVRTLGL